MMKKVRKYYLSPDKNFLICQVYINNVYCGYFSRLLTETYAVDDHSIIDDVTLHDLELHAFMRISHQYIVQPDCLNGEKVEEMFELNQSVV